MPTIPRDKTLDSTLALLRDPYGFVGDRCRKFGSNLFEARLMLRSTICMLGEDAARLFYDETKMIRHGAVPARLQKSLFGAGGVQMLDDVPHRRRKALFMSLMTPERVAALRLCADQEWSRAAGKWKGMDQIVLYDEVREVLTRAVCAWAGVPLDAGDVARRTHQLSAHFDAAGSVALRYWRARGARKQINRWLGDVIERVRAGELTPPLESATHAIAWYRALDGETLPPHVAAVELANVLRPTVAVSVYVTFVAHALHVHQPNPVRLIDDSRFAEHFVHEVRRFYPFFPAVMARARHDFIWRGFRFPAGRRVMLDLYGTNHDPRLWDAPDEFYPERFRAWDGNPYTFIPQGGGDHTTDHRCAGELITVELMKGALHQLTARLTYEVPTQDLQIDHQRLPALPRSRFVIRNVQPRR